MKIIQGDLIQLAIEGQFDLIIHGCNCFCTMGAGIALQIKKRFPKALAADLKTPKGDPKKLGTYSMAVERTPKGKICIINAYTQYHHSDAGVLADYQAIQTVFEKIKKDFPGNRIGYPKIGAGLAGGDFNIIKKIIQTALAGENHTLVEYLNPQGKFKN